MSIDFNEIPVSKGLLVGLGGKAATAVRDAVISKGAYRPVALAMATNPTAGDTVKIGQTTYEFLAAAAQVTDDDFVAVEIGANAGESRDNLVAAINGTADAEHATIFLQSDATEPARGVGTDYVVAVEDSGNIEVRPAKTRGGTASPRAVPGEITATLTAGADGWVDLETSQPWTFDDLGWVDPVVYERALVELTATSDVIAGSGAETVEFPFDIVGFRVSVLTAAGVPKTPDDAFTVSGSVLTITYTGTGIADTDVLTIEAWG